jgi:hypothetical protein
MLMTGQDEKIVTALVKIMKAVEDHLNEIVINETHLGTDYISAGRLEPTLDDILKPWNENAVGHALRQGVRYLGNLFVPHATRKEVETIVNEVGRRSPNSDRARAIMNHMFDRLITNDGVTLLA